MDTWGEGGGPMNRFSPNLIFLLFKKLILSEFNHSFSLNNKSSNLTEEKHNRVGYNFANHILTLCKEQN